MKKRLTALLLAFVLLLSVPALAAENSTDNFVRSKTYSGQFSDVAASSGFYANVAALYEYGLSVGKADGTFGLKDSLSVGQIVIFAGRIRSLYQYGSPETGAAAYPDAGTAAWAPYLAYLQKEGVVGTELDDLLGTAATRSVVAHVLAGTLPSAALPAVNQDLVTQAYATRKFITDVTEYTAYYQDILTLYRCGISMGSDASGSYLPDASITRGAAAAMLTRMVDAALRVTPAWDLSSAYSAKGVTWGSLIPGTTALNPAPTTQAEVTADINYMLQNEQYTLSLHYNRKLTSAFVTQLMNQALSAVKMDCEQLYNAVNCTYELSGGAVNLTFYALDASSSEVAAYRSYTLSAAIAVHDQLWSSGAITASMSQYEKARVYYDWVCQNCRYDYGAAENSISHLGYALFREGKSVCDGYTGAYNLLLKLEGIDCYALNNDTHIWTVAVLDGTTCHIDTTWGDSSGTDTDYTYFGMTEAQSRAYHPW